MYKIPKVLVSIDKDAFNKYRYTVPIHELPAILHKWNPGTVIVGDVSEGEFLTIDTEDELDKMLVSMFTRYGGENLTESYGKDYNASILEAMETIMEKEGIKYGGKNTAELENGVSTEVRV
tara:strand:- start:128 stop:490 length:363 start_codon:yes stop_codon:yes gene_type:complete